MSRIGFGTGSLHRAGSSRKRSRLLHAALDAGVTHFDTSPYYGHGLSEIDVGKSLSLRRDYITLTTKVGLYPRGGITNHRSTLLFQKTMGKIIRPLSAAEVNWSLDKARHSLRGSLRRMHTDYVDFLLLHEPDVSLIPANEFVEWLESERTAGTIRAWGVAGLRTALEPLLALRPALTPVIQTQDSVDIRESDFLKKYKRQPQFTYGYFAYKKRSSKHDNTKETLSLALDRNPEGSILVSTQSEKRLMEMGRLL